MESRDRLQYPLLRNMRSSQQRERKPSRQPSSQRQEPPIKRPDVLEEVWEVSEEIGAHEDWIHGVSGIVTNELEQVRFNKGPAIRGSDMTGIAGALPGHVVDFAVGVCHEVFDRLLDLGGGCRDYVAETGLGAIDRQRSSTEL